MKAPSETTYALAKFWPMFGGFGVLLALILPKPLAIALIILLPVVSSIIVIRGAQTQPVDDELVRERQKYPPRFSIGFYLFALCLPLAALALMLLSVKAFAAAFAFLSAFSVIFYGVLDYSLKRVMLSPIPSIVISFVLLNQYWGYAGGFTFGIMLVIMYPKSVETSIRNQKLLEAINKANPQSEVNTGSCSGEEISV